MNMKEKKKSYLPLKQSIAEMVLKFSFQKVNTQDSIYLFIYKAVRTGI